MKTLDEVINIFEKACDLERRCEDCSGCLSHYEEGCPNDGAEAVPDALFYLKTIETTENLYHDAINELSKLKTEDWKDRCLPLTWDELKAMEGKPVWVEAKSISVGVSPYWKGWYIICSFSNDEFMHCNDGYEWAKEIQGRMWQAYRKERK